jgi:thiosulfate/3-mercaptopyruvate sulfurtransferase
MIRFVVLAVAAATAILSAPIAAQGADEQPGADHPLLVSTGWLAERVDQPGLVVLHVAREEEAYREGHVPGARFLRLGSIVMERDGIPNELPDVEELREAFERAGVSDDSHVVVYGEMGGLAAGRTFFTLDYLGHQRVSLLDGGLEQWRSEGRAVETAARPAERGHFTPRPDPRRVVTADWVHERLDDPGYVLIDARPPAQYTGEDAAGLRPGHIPGAHNLFWRSALVSDDDLRLRPEAELREMFERAGASSERTVVAYCRTGVQASHAYFVARMLGYDVVMFDGSYVEWSGRSDLPIAQPQG